MTPSSPTRFRPAMRGLIALGCAAFMAFGTPVSAQTTEPSSPGTGGGHFATARIADVEWCGVGVIGDVDTDRSGGPAVARWSTDAEGVAGDQHFQAPPEDAYSRVAVADDRLSARAGIEEARFDPACALLPAGGGEPAPTLAQVFGADALLTVESVASQARWTQGAGANASLEVRGMEVLGAPVDVGAGTYERTFTGEGPQGRVTVGFTARAAVHELDEGGTDTASAGLTLEFDVDAQGAGGGDLSGTYRLDLAGAGVHSASPAQAPDRGEGGTDPRPAPEPAPGPTAGGPSGPDPDGGGSGGDSEGGDSGGSDGSADTGDGGGDGGDGGDGSDHSGDGGSAGATPSPSAPSGSLGPDDLALDPGTRSSGGPLPLTGGTLVGLAGAAVASLTAGGIALFLGRSRSSDAGDP